MSPADLDAAELAAVADAGRVFLAFGTGAIDAREAVRSVIEIIESHRGTRIDPAHIGLGAHLLLHAVEELTILASERGAGPTLRLVEPQGEPPSEAS